MLKTTIKKTETILKNNGVKLMSDSIVPLFLHFEVTNKEGDKIDVWRRIVNDLPFWSCNRVKTEKSGKKWGCVMFNVDRTNAFCSHTLAAQVYYESIKNIGGKTNESKEFIESGKSRT